MRKNFMYAALEEAKKADAIAEIPIGAVVVKNDEIIARGYNLRESTKMISQHAEINAMEKAMAKLGTWKLEDCELYVTVEPCLMCYGAITQSRIKTVYVGSKQLDFKKTTYRFYISEPELAVEELLLDECSQIMQEFFKKMRKRRK